MPTPVRIGAGRGGGAHRGASGGEAPGAYSGYGTPTSVGQGISPFAFQAAQSQRAYNAKDNKGGFSKTGLSLD